MANGLRTCEGCDRHIKMHESSCPFCGAPTSGPRAVRRPVRRLSRAMWIAAGSSIVPAGILSAACSSTTEAETATVDASPDTSSADATSPDTTGPRETTWADAASGQLLCDREGPPEPGVVPCGETTCDRATEYCQTTTSTFCRPYEPPKTTRSCVPRKEGRLPPECQACQTCACIAPLLIHRDTPPVGVGEDWSCADLEGGGLALELYSVSCNSCYGCPPARLVG